MEKIKVMSVFGTRPETIKMAPLVKELERREEFESLVCVTAQHRQMLDQVLEAFSITPDYDLDIMQPGQTLSDITARVLKGLEGVIQEVKPDMVLVHGDTTTTFAAALAAYYGQTAVGHVEAGLRTYDKYSPFPEEMNRQFVGCVADLHFAPTEGACQNLLREGKAAGVHCGHRQHRHRRPANHRAGGLLRRDFAVGARAPGSSCSPPTGGRTWASPCTACSEPSAGWWRSSPT